MIHDLLIVGGGINGCAIAREAALNGLSVLLVERDDLAAHTSSASTKLIHGGLRYLEYYDFRLVAEALRERGWSVLARTSSARWRSCCPMRTRFARGGSCAQGSSFTIGSAGARGSPARADCDQVTRATSPR